MVGPGEVVVLVHSPLLLAKALGEAAHSHHRNLSQHPIAISRALVRGLLHDQVLQMKTAHSHHSSLSQHPIVISRAVVEGFIHDQLLQMKAADSHHSLSQHPIVISRAVVRGLIHDQLLQQIATIVVLVSILLLSVVL